MTSGTESVCLGEKVKEGRSRNYKSMPDALLAGSLARYTAFGDSIVSAVVIDDGCVEQQDERH